MTSKMVLFVAVLAVVFGQACSKSYTEITGPQDEGSLSGDSTTIVKPDGKFLCDFKWTDGPKKWSYTSGDNPVGNEIAKEPWCLIPYESSATFSITAKSDEGVNDYVCRDLNAQYSLRNLGKEAVLTSIITSISEEEGPQYTYETHKQMWCVPINDSIVISVYNLGLDYKNEKLYHIRKTDDVYTIDGHLNLKFVRRVELSVLFEIFRNSGLGRDEVIYYENIEKDSTEMIKEWKNYMRKAGYELTITYIAVPIPHPNINERVKDNILTIPYNFNTADESIDINKYYGADNYDYVIGVTSASTHNSLFKDVFSLNVGNGFILTDKDFFGKDLGAKTKSRALSSLLYSKILGYKPLEFRNTDKSSWLSVYPFYISSPLEDVDIFTQPSKDWELGRSPAIRLNNQLYIASIMQNFARREK